MTVRIPLAAAAATACLALVGPVLAQAPSSPSAPSPAPSPATSPEDALPAGPGKDVVVRVCTACHDASQFAFARYTPEEWDGEVAKVQGAGAEVTAEEQTAISAYLAKNLNSKPAAPAPDPAAETPPPPTVQASTWAICARSSAMLASTRSL